MAAGWHTLDLIDAFHGSWGWVGFLSCTSVAVGTGPPMPPSLPLPPALPPRPPAPPAPPSLPVSIVDADGLLATFAAHRGAALKYSNQVEAATAGGGRAYDSTHPPLVLRSPLFYVEPAETTVSCEVIGGVGGAVAPLAATATWPTSSSDDGFMGIAARSVASDSYVAHARRSSNGENAPETVALDLSGVAAGWHRST